jgi:hypothetical protein
MFSVNTSYTYIHLLIGVLSCISDVQQYSSWSSSVCGAPFGYLEILEPDRNTFIRGDRVPGSALGEPGSDPAPACFLPISPTCSNTALGHLELSARHLDSLDNSLTCIPAVASQLVS